MVLVFGHRGAMGYAPENTLPSFRMAVDMGVDGVELDVHMTKDGEIVVIHDFTVDRTTNGSGYIKDLTLAEVKSFDASARFGGKWRDVRVPTLEEVFREFGRRIKYKVEIKRGSDYYPGIEGKVVDLIRRYNVDAQVISFDFDALGNVRAIDKDVEIGVIFVGRIAWFIDIAKKLDAQWLHASHDLIDEKGVEMAHRFDLRVGAWTVNNEDYARHLVRIGVDDITSNYPDRILRVVKTGKVI
ncbi:glycerophosphodiester phosphodiesterase [Vulcanisaeta souniana]|uniref:Glycerophosphoryl diester phosphodiesterase n=1 Tax=Vulcanisaeta souniana JCM 11219 TaxID=1293586 RepID=A0A830DZH2_9CREN|nr:glycerophosphodiester phosphodiesterase family protein [Vulcanisaeta souniana]BDR91606.1 glycerophosphoryl diester phosphodiesterase [Vulcanisaeta souniana JCM 11219]GGI71942.1 glycerophosphoryl diester phosphodiesterase [Vulcanisaeta souniana JCM 11219]